MLRSRASRRDQPEGRLLVDLAEHPDAGGGPEHEALLADALGPALQVVLETLGPAERLAFVLHDVFALPFIEIGDILGRSPDAAKQLASRARRRLQGSTPDMSADMPRQRVVVDAFLAASRRGDLDGLVAVLDPDIVLRADATAVQMGSPPEVRGSAEVAKVFSGRALAAQPALVDGIVGITWAPGGRARTGGSPGSTWWPTPTAWTSSTW
jgi:RNA polymerase sigma-70 factor (ECF subfamily)